MCKNNANESVENALRNNGFNECYDGNAFEKILTDEECRELWKYIGIPEKYFHNQEMRILMIKNGSADAFIPQYFIYEAKLNGTIISDPSDVEKMNKEILGE